MSKIREEAERMTRCVAIPSLARQAEITLILLGALEEMLNQDYVLDEDAFLLQRIAEEAIAKAEEV